MKTYATPHHSLETSHQNLGVVWHWVCVLTTKKYNKWDCDFTTRNLCPPLRLIFGLFFILLTASAGFSHEIGAPFSGAISEPVILHHAHIEDEQSLNMFFRNDFQKEEDAEKRFAFESALELASSWGDHYNFGSEIFIPFSETGNDNDRYAVGDIELWPIKYAFLNEPETIVTGALSIGLPTGDKKYGFGEGQTKLGAMFFIDQAWRNWYFGANAELESVVAGPTETEAEFAFGLSYSFIEGTGDGVAAPRPSQTFVPVLSLEMVAEQILSGLEKENDSLTILPGMHLWHPASDWLVSVGLEVPLSSYRNNDYTMHLKMRNHFNWGSFF